MSVSVGQKERETKKRVVKLFLKELKYDYLGFWKDCEGNSNIEEDVLRQYLQEERGYTETIVSRALFELRRAAEDSTKSLYDRNSAVYGLLRYGVKVREGGVTIRKRCGLSTGKNRIKTSLPLRKR